MGVYAIDWSVVLCRRVWQRYLGRWSQKAYRAHGQDRHAQEGDLPIIYIRGWWHISFHHPGGEKKCVVWIRGWRSSWVQVPLHVRHNTHWIHRSGSGLLGPI